LETSLRRKKIRGLQRSIASSKETLEERGLQERGEFSRGRPKRGSTVGKRVRSAPASLKKGKGARGDLTGRELADKGSLLWQRI